MTHKQKRLGTGLYEYRDMKIEKTSINLGKKEVWVFHDDAGTNYQGKTLKQCKEWIDTIIDQ